MRKGYMCSYFFDQATFNYTEYVAKQVESIKNVALYVPQRNESINNKEKNDATITAKGIYKVDTHELLNSHFMVAIIDGIEIDSGVSAEIGMISGFNEVLAQIAPSAKPMPIFALYTDIRRNGSGDNRLYRNQYTIGAIKTWGAIYDNVDDLCFAISNWIITENILKQEEIQDR